MKPIARIHSDFATKFGIPRQSGVVGSLQAEIIFEPEFRSRDAVRGLEAFSHIWLIWEFSENVRADWSPTVRPPRLGGNVRMGVFATRSPFRPNPIGLSCVRLEDITFSDARGPVLHVAGADLMDGTPIYDIKPTFPTPTASGGDGRLHRSGGDAGADRDDPAGAALPLPRRQARCAHRRAHARPAPPVSNRRQPRLRAGIRRL